MDAVSFWLSPSSIVLYALAQHFNSVNTTFQLLSSLLHTFFLCTTLDELRSEGCINYCFTVSREVNQKSRILLYTVLKSSFSIHSTMFAMSDRSGWPVHV